MYLAKKAALVSSAAMALVFGLTALAGATGQGQTEKSVDKNTLQTPERLQRETVRAQPQINREALQAVRVQNAAPPEFERSQAEFKNMSLDDNNVYDFLVWAATSPRVQKEAVRAEIAARSGDEKISTQIQKLYPEILRDDFDFALVTLGVLGELKAKNSVKFFAGVLNQGYPADKTAADPGLTRREAIELLQSKAVQGLAYLGDDAATAIVLEAARSHPSRAVRSTAAEAFMFNAANKDDARKKLEDTLRAEDKVFLDTVSKGAMRNQEEFNKQLAEFYQRHPNEQFAPPGEPQGPERADEPVTDKDENRIPRAADRKPR